jgi:hypothetical protein
MLLSKGDKNSPLKSRHPRVLRPFLAPFHEGEEHYVGVLEPPCCQGLEAWQTTTPPARTPEDQTAHQAITA